MAKDEIPHLSIRLTDERKLMLAQLRQELDHRQDGKRVHGLLTDAQLIDWGLEALLKEARKTSPQR